jgi:hypothetical protein
LTCTRGEHQPKRICFVVGGNDEGESWRRVHSQWWLPEIGR